MALETAPRRAAPGPHERLVERVRRGLLRSGAPRLLMSAVVALTGLAGLAASVALRRVGLRPPGR